MKTARIVTEAIALGAGSIALESRGCSKPSLVTALPKMTPDLTAVSSPCPQQPADAGHPYPLRHDLLDREDTNAIAAIIDAVGHNAPPTMLEMQK